MSEQEVISPKTPQEQFTKLKDYYAKAISEGRMHTTSFYEEVFLNPDTGVYAEFADDEMISIIARTMNESWKGRESIGRVDSRNK